MSGDISMSVLDSIAQGWLSWTLAASWQLAVLVCIVAAVNAMARGASPRLRHALWLVVLVKAFLPASLSMPWSLGKLVIAPVAALASSSAGVAIGGPGAPAAAQDADRPGEQTARAADPTTARTVG